MDHNKPHNLINNKLVIHFIYRMVHHIQYSKYVLVQTHVCYLMTSKSDLTRSELKGLEKKGLEGLRDLTFGVFQEPSKKLRVREVRVFKRKGGRRSYPRSNLRYSYILHFTICTHITSRPKADTHPHSRFGIQVVVIQRCSVWRSLSFSGDTYKCRVMSPCMKWSLHLEQVGGSGSSPVMCMTSSMIHPDLAYSEYINVEGNIVY